jgi:hypothetical protein
MQRHLNLIKSEKNVSEKRTFPRFPFCFMTFKSEKEQNKVYQITDISFTGMRLCLKSGGTDYQLHSDIKGIVHWHGQTLDIGGVVQWRTEDSLGVEFTNNPIFRENILEFLSIDHISNNLKSLHNSPLDLEIPNDLTVWLSTDGPVEIFVWSNRDGSVSKFQFVLMDHFVEWDMPTGIKTGVVASKKDKTTPLMSEDEFTFEIDQENDETKVQFARDILRPIGPEKIPTEIHDFMLVKLGN